MKVYIVGGGREYEEMFMDRGWCVVENIEKADLIQFTGGEDVHPSLYNEQSHPSTYSRKARDDREGFIVEDYAGRIPMAGICRGGQFLNVMNGGTLFQDVDNHAIGHTHGALILDRNRVIQVTSTHHQMMIPSVDGEVLLISRLSKRREKMLGGRPINVGGGEDTEAVLYRKSKCLCFQPHPEFEDAPTECTDYYFELIDELMEM